MTRSQHRVANAVVSLHAANRGRDLEADADAAAIDWGGLRSQEFVWWREIWPRRLYTAPDEAAATVRVRDVLSEAGLTRQPGGWRGGDLITRVATFDLAILAVAPLLAPGQLLGDGVVVGEGGPLVLTRPVRQTNWRGRTAGRG